MQPTLGVIVMSGFEGVGGALSQWDYHIWVGKDQKHDWFWVRTTAIYFCKRVWMGQ